jgi:hypothetical protein
MAQLSRKRGADDEGLPSAALVAEKESLFSL